MARRECDEKNELTIHDNISDSDVTLHYRMPTTRERQDYQNATMQRRGNKLVFNHAAARLNFGMVILTGFGAGAFERKVDDQYVAFSAVEGEGNYYPEWREWVKKNAADLVMLLAARVFDASATIPGADEPEDDEPEDLEGK